MTFVQEQVNKSIIIADDDDLLRENIVEILIEVGYSVRAASTGAEAQEQYEAEPADLVITNIFLPDMDGIELVRAFFDSGENTRLMAMSTIWRSQMRWVPRRHSESRFGKWTF